MKLETALQKPRTVPELVKLTRLSRGGVLAGLKRLKAKKAGSKANARGPKSTLYVKASPKVRRAAKARAQEGLTPSQPASLFGIDAAPSLMAANVDANGAPVADVTSGINKLAEDTIAAAVAESAEKPLEPESATDNLETPLSE